VMPLVTVCSRVVSDRRVGQDKPTRRHFLPSAIDDHASSI